MRVGTIDLEDLSYHSLDIEQAFGGVQRTSFTTPATSVDEKSAIQSTSER